MKRRLSLFGLLAVMIVGLLSSLAVAQGVEKYSPVTSERLLKPEPENWLMYRGTYDGWGYSPLWLMYRGTYDGWGYSPLDNHPPECEEAGASVDLLHRC